MLFQLTEGSFFQMHMYSMSAVYLLLEVALYLSVSACHSGSRVTLSCFSFDHISVRFSCFALCFVLLWEGAGRAAARKTRWSFFAPPSSSATTAPLR